MGAVDTTYTFTPTDTITSTKMNNIIDETVMTSDAIIGTTLEISSGKLRIRSGGITSNEMGANSVTANAITDGAITDVEISGTAAISLSKLATGALPTAITIATANLVDANVTTPKIADANVTAAKLSGAQTGTAPIFGVRAWAKLNPYVGSVRTGAYKNGNYSTASGTTTVTIASHGLKPNDRIRLDFTSGTATDGLYEVLTAPDANTFTITGAGGTSGNVTAQFVAIQRSGNISSASWFNSVDEIILFNYAVPMPNEDYAISATGQLFPGSWFSAATEATSGTTQINTIHQGYVYMNQPNRFLNVVVIG